MVSSRAARAVSRSALDPGPSTRAAGSVERCRSSRDGREGRPQVAATLNPEGRDCFGFKEIRYGGPDFAKNVAWLGTLCAEPRIVLHMRRDIEKELDAAVNRRNKADRRQKLMAQRACFASYARPRAEVRRELEDLAGFRAQANATEGPCPRPEGAPPVFLHYLEDYIYDTPREAALWKFLGLPRPNGTAVCLGSRCRRPGNITQ